MAKKPYNVGMGQVILYRGKGAFWLAEVLSQPANPFGSSTELQETYLNRIMSTCAE